MVASILAKKKSVSATHVLIDIPVGRSAKVRTYAAGEKLAALFRAVAAQIDLRLEVVLTDARAPIGRGIGRRLEGHSMRWRFYGVTPVHPSICARSHSTSRQGFWR